MKKLKCWKKDEYSLKGEEGERFIGKKGKIATTILSPGLKEQVCILYKNKDSKCFYVKDMETPKEALNKLMSANDKC